MRLVSRLRISRLTVRLLAAICLTAALLALVQYARLLREFLEPGGSDRPTHSALWRSKADFMPGDVASPDEELDAADLRAVGTYIVKGQRLELDYEEQEKPRTSYGRETRELEAPGCCSCCQCATGTALKIVGSPWPHEQRFGDRVVSESVNHVHRVDALWSEVEPSDRQFSPGASRNDTGTSGLPDKLAHPVDGDAVHSALLLEANLTGRFSKSSEVNKTRTVAQSGAKLCPMPYQGTGLWIGMEFSCACFHTWQTRKRGINEDAAV